MRTRLERKIDHIISMIDHKYNNFSIMDFDKKRVNKISKDIMKFNADELYELLMKLFSEKHNEKVVEAFIFDVADIKEPYLRYNAELSKKYDGKNFIQLAIENDYRACIIKKLLNSYVTVPHLGSQDKNGFTLLHTLVNSNASNKFFIYESVVDYSRTIEDIKDNNNNTYIDLAKKKLEELEGSLSFLHRPVFLDEKKYNLGNIICDYYNRHFDKFLDMFTDDVEANKKLILDNLVFHDDSFGMDKERNEKYEISNLLFRCINSNKNVEKTILNIKKLLETGYPIISSKENNNNFISYAIQKGYRADFIIKIFEMFDELGEGVINWMYYEILITYIDEKSDIVLRGELFDLYDYFCDRGFDLLKVDIDEEIIKNYEERIKCPIKFYGDGTYYAFLKKMVIEMHNALLLKKINQELLFCGYDKVINSCRSFSGKRLLEYDIDAVDAEEIASKIIENRKDAIYESDEITKEEVILAIEECKPILDDFNEVKEKAKVYYKERALL